MIRLIEGQAQRSMHSTDIRDAKCMADSKEVALDAMQSRMLFRELRGCAKADLDEAETIRSIG